MQQLSTCLKKWGVVGDVVGATPRKMTRGAEIRAWLDGRSDVESFAILDDDGCMAVVQDHLVQVPNPMRGLLMPEALRAVKILEGKT